MNENNKTLNICFIYCQELGKKRSGYSEQHPCRMAKVLGDSAKVFALFAGDGDKEYFIENGVVPIQIETQLLGQGYFKKLLGLIYYTRKIGIEYKIDIFMNVWSHYLMLPVYLGSRLCKSKCVGSIGGLPIKSGYLNKPKNFKNVLRKKIGLTLEYLSLLAVDNIHCVSHELKKKYIERSIPERKIKVISRGIDFNLFTRKISYEKELSNQITIGTVCNLVKLKDVETSIDSIQILRKKYHNIRFLIGGDGEYKDHLIEYVKRKELENNVIFVGYLNRKELIQFYSSIDIFVLSSVSEGIANVILEALSFGLEIIATNVGDIPRHLDNGRGKTFPVGDVDAMVDLVMSCIESNDCNLTKSVQRRHYVQKNHSFESVRMQYNNFFRQTIKNG
jgi:glycosyltransferase involved in cell wall biosynthesis